MDEHLKAWDFFFGDEDDENEITEIKPNSQQTYIRRDRASADARLHSDYFGAEPLYNDRMFQRRFRMSKELFLNICSDLQKHDRYWIQKTVRFIDVSINS